MARIDTQAILACYALDSSAPEIHALITVLGGLCQQGRQAVRYDGGGVRWRVGAVNPNAGGVGDGAGVEGRGLIHGTLGGARGFMVGVRGRYKDTDDGSAALALC